jgi:hypothetical protein
MQRFLWSSALVIAAAGALWAYQNEARQSATRGWEYAIVENWRSVGGSRTPEGDRFRVEFHARATICYMQESGCKVEEIDVTPSFLEEKGQNQPNHWEDARQAAVAKAMALLGSAGWELVGSGPALTWQTDINNPAAPVAPALYFKRVKQ